LEDNGQVKHTIHYSSDALIGQENTIQLPVSSGSSIIKCEAKNEFGVDTEMWQVVKDGMCHSLAMVVIALLI